MKNQILPLVASAILTLSLLSCEESRSLKKNENKSGPDISSKKTESTQTKKTKIKLAIILDTSNSMDGNRSG